MLLTQQDNKGSVFIMMKTDVYLILHFVTILIILVQDDTDLKNLKM